MIRANKDGIGVEETREESEHFFADPSNTHYVALPQRPGVQDCVTTLEQVHYPVDSPRNDLFHFRYLVWEDLQWFIISIPATDRAIMERVTLAHGLRIADGVPTMLSFNGVKRFPIDQENVFTLENIPSHPVYQ
jgi:hypothetical protein